MEYILKTCKDELDVMQIQIGCLPFPARYSILCQIMMKYVFVCCFVVPLFIGFSDSPAINVGGRFRMHFWEMFQERMLVEPPTYYKPEME